MSYLLPYLTSLTMDMACFLRLLGVVGGVLFIHIDLLEVGSHSEISPRAIERRTSNTSIFPKI